MRKKCGKIGKIGKIERIERMRLEITDCAELLGGISFIVGAVKAGTRPAKIAGLFN
jgi:hypothetical protein